MKKYVGICGTLKCFLLRAMNSFSFPGPIHSQTALVCYCNIPNTWIQMVTQELHFMEAWILHSSFSESYWTGTFNGFPCVFATSVKPGERHPLESSFFWLLVCMTNTQAEVLGAPPWLAAFFCFPDLLYLSMFVFHQHVRTVIPAQDIRGCKPAWIETLTDAYWLK